MSQAGILDIDGSNPQIPTSFTTDSGTAVPIANNLEILGSTGITTSGSGKTVTISLTGGGIAIDQINVDAATAPGTDPVVPTAAGEITLTGAQVASSGVGANVIRTNSLAANSATIEVQQSGSAAAENTALNGVAHFNSDQFSVSNGFVSLAGQGLAVDSFAVDTGTSPVTPNASGQVTFSGATVAAGTSPVRTNGTGSNAMQLEVQISQALAAADSTKIGLSNFDSTSFAVAATGFVTLSGGGFTWNDVSGAFSPLKSNGYFVTGTATGTLPASPAQGDTIKFFVDHATQDLTIDAPGTQLIRIGTLISSAGGTAVSTAQGDSLELVYRTATTTWEAVCGFSGTWVLA